MIWGRVGLSAALLATSALAALAQPPGLPSEPAADGGGAPVHVTPVAPEPSAPATPPPPNLADLQAWEWSWTWDERRQVQITRSQSALDEPVGLELQH